MPSFVFQPPGARSTRTFEVHKRITSIGSGDDNDLTIPDPDVDETHALIRYDGRTFTVQTLGSAKVLVNGNRARKHDLEHGDIVQLGRTALTFRLFDEDQAADAPRAELLETYRAVLDLSRTLMQSYELPELLEQLMDSIIELTRADKGFLILVEDEELHVKVARNIGGGDVEGALEQFSDSIVATVIEEKKPLIVADALNHEDFSASRSVVNLKVCSVMCVPMLVGDELAGLIYVGNDNVVNLFTNDHLEALTIFAAQAALIVSRALAMDELIVDNRKLREQLDDIRFGTIIGACDAMKQIYRRVERVAKTDVSVLVQGETGTGKELIAREIHARSDRRDGPFVTINCGAIPENLLESELFGHVRGAFTGATSNRAGRFQAANGGTLFLDEIGEMPLNLQVKILRALQERTVTRVGETRAEHVDIRVIAATHRDLQAMIADGEFREDLFYRLNVVSLTLPPLRDREEDVVLIAKYFLERFAREYGVGKRQFTRESTIAMRKFGWPGNIRQLENHIKKAVILSEGSSIHAADLDLNASGMRDILPLAEAREEWQSRYIRSVLEMNDGNRTKTARDLGVDPRTVFRFLEKESERDDDEA